MSKKKLYELTYSGYPGVTPGWFLTNFWDAMWPYLNQMEGLWGVRPEIKACTEPRIYISASFTVKNEWAWTHAKLGTTRTRHKRTYIRVTDQPLVGNNHPFAQACILACPYYNGGAGHGVPRLPRPWPKLAYNTAVDYANLLERGLGLLGLPVTAPIRVSEAFALCVTMKGRRTRDYTYRVQASHDTVKRVKPHLEARNVARQLSNIRQWGQEVALAPLRVRHRAGDSLYQHYIYQWQQGKVQRDIKGVWTVLDDPELAGKLLASLDLPPDPLEMVLEPKLSRLLVARLRAEGKPYEWCPGFLEKQGAIRAQAEAEQMARAQEAHTARQAFGRPSRQIIME